MPRFTIEGRDIDPLEIESDNWMSALGDALEMLGASTGIEGIECEVLSDGSISVESPIGQFTIHEMVETIARIRVGPARPDANGRLPNLAPEVAPPPPSPLDAPDPMESPAFKARAESAEVLVREVADRALSITPGEAAAAAALDLIMEFVPAEAGAVLLAERGTGDLVFAAARGPRARALAGTRVPAGKGIAGLAVRSGITLTVREAKRDPRHYREVDDKTGYRTQAILSVPVRTGRGTVGCIELLNPFAGTEFAGWHANATRIVADRLGELLG